MWQVSHVDPVQVSCGSCAGMARQVHGTGPYGPVWDGKGPVRYRCGAISLLSPCHNLTDLYHTTAGPCNPLIPGKNEVLWGTKLLHGEF